MQNSAVYGFKFVQCPYVALMHDMCRCQSMPLDESFPSVPMMCGVGAIAGGLGGVAGGGCGGVHGISAKVMASSITQWL